MYDDEQGKEKPLLVCYGWRILCAFLCRHVFPAIFAPEACVNSLVERFVTYYNREMREKSYV